ncbi:hypothetical protein AXF42_Ash003529 [Apostasia shenzhenica]|uniref:Sororin C-terminal region domain-containing protein n=1 Tax=Apostasia shenzhenica TaxID=1088818 RepID=A0A2I0BGH3_9ASPA|nr:hypothetical protein AXF42_Ash003529 [Apostasia shenzhenica]
MEARRSESSQRRPTRRPLADLTNGLPLRSHAAFDPLKPEALRKVNPDPASSKSSVSSAGSSDPKKPADLEAVERTPIAKGASLISGSSVVSGEKGVLGGKKDGRPLVALQHVKKIIKETEKDALATTSLSCPPLGRRTQNAGKKSKMKRGNIVLNEACSVPCDKKKKRRRGGKTTEEDVPLEDFIKKQRAYFAEVDAFELPEEVVSESELD